MFIRVTPRGCGKATTPVACCCICDAINLDSTISIQDVRTRDRPPNNEFMTTGALLAPKTIWTFFGGGQKVEVSKPTESDPKATAQEVIPDWLGLGHELCTHAQGIDGDKAVEVENKLRSERKDPLAPRTGRDHPK